MADDDLALLREIFRKEPLPKPLHLLELTGSKVAEPGGKKLSKAAMAAIAAIRSSNRGLLSALGLADGFQPEERLAVRTRNMLGQLVLGLLAERAFEEIYRSALGTTDLRLEDSRESRNETDYRVLNGQGRAVFRINIKFHGTLFRKAKDLVGLDPEDCFALATYKIKQGLDKQEAEVLPYVFVVVSCPVTAAQVGAAIPARLVELATLVHASKKVTGKRLVEERIVRYLASGRVRSFESTLRELVAKISDSPWRVISARRADLLLRETLFERVYAVRVRAFTRNYRNAELDMHFSLSSDMTPLIDLLKQIGDLGLHGVVGKLERGLL